MADTITLQLTRAEALALDALVENSAVPFFGVVDGDKDYSGDGWNRETAASACDKLRAAVTGEDSPLTWSRLIQQLDYDAR